MSMAWVPGCRRNMCPKAPRRSLRIVVVKNVGVSLRERIGTTRVMLGMSLRTGGTQL